ncbi:MAG: type II secretion system protein [Steroidobacteraceae bacterium]
MQSHQSRGFTLIELVVVITIGNRQHGERDHGRLDRHRH